MRFYKTILVLLAVAISFASCKKDDATPEDTRTLNEKRMEMLTTKDWKVTDYSLIGLDASTGEDFSYSFADMDACEKDDLYSYTMGGQYSINPGTEKCFEDDELYTSSWELNDEGTEISYDLDDDPETYEIVSMSEQMLIVHDRYEESDGSFWETTLTYSSN